MDAILADAAEREDDGQRAASVACEEEVLQRRRRACPHERPRRLARRRHVDDVAEVADVFFGEEGAAALRVRLCEGRVQRVLGERRAALLDVGALCATVLEHRRLVVGALVQRGERLAVPGREALEGRAEDGERRKCAGGERAFLRRPVLGEAGEPLVPDPSDGQLAARIPLGEAVVEAADRVVGLPLQLCRLRQQRVKLGVLVEEDHRAARDDPPL
mmetsp:Transcript_32907/g.105552  ORF Transcript_32907/g.105552 Transcript_32907/m.105552 type:complete len:217 (+) Transcript_32907:394-1044(+)